jgi:DNA-binding Lrp family transcriptional regulator
MRKFEADVQFDAIDAAILRELQHDARLSNVELANRVQLSPSACLRRVKLLEDALRAFEQAVADEPRIQDCFYVAGSNDYLLRFTYRDADDLERFYGEVLSRLPGVVRSNSMLVLRTVKRTTALALRSELRQ